MNALAKTVFRSIVMVLVLLAAPVAVRAPSGTDVVPVRIAGACADPTECELSPSHICRLGEENFVGYKCSRGCDPPPPGQGGPN